MIALLDTDVLIASRTAAEGLPDLRGFDDLVVSSVSYSELTMGLHAAAELIVYKQRSARLEALTRTFGPGLPYDDDCVRAYGRLLSVVVDRGGEPKAHRLDRMIAATAIANGFTLVTRNAAHYRLLEGMVDVEVR